jgi:hypothetical protein
MFNDPTMLMGILMFASASVLILAITIVAFIE